MLDKIIIPRESSVWKGINVKKHTICMQKKAGVRRGIIPSPAV